MTPDLDAIEAMTSDPYQYAQVSSEVTRGYLAALVAEVRALRAVAEEAEQVAGAYANPWASEDDRLTTVDALAPALDALDGA